MTAHVYNGRLDHRYPATLSRRTVAGLLRKKLGFRGVVVTDDLRMGAIVERYGPDEAIVLAANAGVDLLLIADDRMPDGGSASQRAVMALRHALAERRISPRRVDDALARIAALKSKLRSAP
jgi:beta-N-acetylhexosaminidase